MISATTFDWNRETVRRFWDPSRKLLYHLRRYQAQTTGTLRCKLLRKWHAFFHQVWSVICGADIPLNSQIGGGLIMPHPNGIVIHPDAVIGANCLFFQQVTIGTGGKQKGCPRIGGHVDIGAGAKVLGGVVIGDHAKIGANAVVLCDVPNHATAVGIPARILKCEVEEQRVDERFG
ncbi:Serine acetyltransferase [Symmachiella macrocystis]|uniref:Serine acetyltransferase n=1 Tax=Symmachiella macrocystis TaxID=2527985 RepID=A0A5C6BIJ1_9PLAN|nr:serine O-acetyltransferase [Symmachiella macrocystis]TWU11820.1 Serine acetyltransferase [Symmachiella macrocystis]